MANVEEDFVSGINFLNGYLGANSQEFGTSPLVILAEINNLRLTEVDKGTWAHDLGVAFNKVQYLRQVLQAKKGNGDGLDEQSAESLRQLDNIHQAIALAFVNVEGKTIILNERSRFTELLRVQQVTEI